MKTKHLLLSAVILFTGLTGITQNITSLTPASKSIFPFGKKLPPPNVNLIRGRALQQNAYQPINSTILKNFNHTGIIEIKKQLDFYRQQLKEDRNMQALHVQPAGSSNVINQATNNNFHLTKDIYSLKESYPANGSDFGINPSFAVLHGVVYFAADDGIHGSELWRSDGTAAGTYMVKDIESGNAASGPYNITAANGKIYFSAITAENGLEPWVSDGTEQGTNLLLDVKPGPAWSYATEFVSCGNDVYFVTDGDFSIWGALWKTDGTTAGTVRVRKMGDEGSGGYLISQLTAIDNVLYFTFANFNTNSWELWKSLGTYGGTHRISNTYFAYIPAQLTKYNKKLYFSADEGNGRKLWISDGTSAGTNVVPGNDVLIEADYIGTTFPVLNDVLYMPGYLAGKPDALYKYNPWDPASGIVKVKIITAYADPAFIIPSEMKVVNDRLYFKVTDYNGGLHDELWSSKGDNASTQLESQFQSGEFIYDLCNGGGTFYFIKHDKWFGSELWRVLNTPFAQVPILVMDIFKGPTSSYPNFLTALNGKLIFSATDDKKGTELFMTDGAFFTTALVKDINTTTSGSSFAGYYINTMTALGNKVVFAAAERVYNNEPYKSDGSEQGTHLLNDIVPGESGSYPYNLVTKNNAAYFIASGTDTTYSVYKTDGTTQGLQRLTANYVYYQYFLADFSVANNGLVFYVLYNYSTGYYELWSTDGSSAGTYLLTPSLYDSYYLNTAGNTAFFVAGDSRYGYELWKSDGTVHGTKLVKDINPGTQSSTPGGMFVFNNEVYFGAIDGTSNNYSFWKSDGTNSGTIKLKEVDPWWGLNVFQTERYFFGISNNLLYFGAFNHYGTHGSQLYKTDGTVSGTQKIVDINASASGFYPFPNYFVDVNGTIFFLSDDGVHGQELWKSDGTKNGTQLVKDISPGASSSFLDNLVSFAGKLYFTNSGQLWSSDGTEAGTVQVNDAGLNNVQVYNIVTASSQMFLSGYSLKYGVELYAGNVANETGQFVSSVISGEAIKASLPFNATLYPNPAVSNTKLQITGNAKNVSVSVTDMNGKKIWQINNSNATLVNLPTEKFPAGNYLVTVTNGTESKTIKLVKQ